MSVAVPMLLLFIYMTNYQGDHTVNLIECHLFPSYVCILLYSCTFFIAHKILFMLKSNIFREAMKEQVLCEQKILSINKLNFTFNKNK